jgi:hypothetical protein
MRTGTSLAGKNSAAGWCGTVVKKNSAFFTTHCSSLQQCRTVLYNPAVPAALFFTTHFFLAHFRTTSWPLQEIIGG